MYLFILLFIYFINQVNKKETGIYIQSQACVVHVTEDEVRLKLLENNDYFMSE